MKFSKWPNLALVIVEVDTSQETSRTLCHGNTADDSLVSILHVVTNCKCGTLGTRNFERFLRNLCETSVCLMLISVCDLVPLQWHESKVRLCLRYPYCLQQ